MSENFQSSFYKDTLWNHMRRDQMGKRPKLSILILQGHSLKLQDVLAGRFDNAPFQSSFYKDTLWNQMRILVYSDTCTLSILILQGHSLKL